MPSNSPSARRDVSVMCRECFALVGGVEAGDAVRWTTCERCVERIPPRRLTLTRYLLTYAWWAVPLAVLCVGLLRPLSYREWRHCERYGY